MYLRVIKSTVKAKQMLKVSKSTVDKYIDTRSHVSCFTHYATYLI